MEWKQFRIPKEEITEAVTGKSECLAKKFGVYLSEELSDPIKVEKLTTSQLRKFFGEVKRQQLSGFNETDFAMLKPKLAYVAGRAHKNDKRQNEKQYRVDAFYHVLSEGIDIVLNSENKENSFKNFISIFEAIVAYHKAAENGIDLK